MAAVGNSRSEFAVVFVSFLCFFPVLSYIEQERQGLLDFAAQLVRKGRINWDDSIPVCSWFGLECHEDKASVYALKLPGSKLHGQIAPNGLYGTIPPDFTQLTFLRSLYLQGNWFSGGFPPPIVELKRMNRLDVSNNQFTGPIPYDLNNLTQMNGFFVQNNQFSGEIPSLNMCFVNFDASNNNLVGQIPVTLKRFPAAAFAANTDLCCRPLPPCRV